MQEPKKEEIKELTINSKMVANYVIGKGVLFLKQRMDNLSEDLIIEIIRCMEKQKFKYVAYLNIK